MLFNCLISICSIFNVRFNCSIFFLWAIILVNHLKVPGPIFGWAMPNRSVKVMLVSISSAHRCISYSCATLLLRLAPNKFGVTVIGGAFCRAFPWGGGAVTAAGLVMKAKKKKGPLTHLSVTCRTLSRGVWPPLDSRWRALWQKIQGVFSVRCVSEMWHFQWWLFFLLPRICQTQWTPPRSRTNWAFTAYGSATGTFKPPVQPVAMDCMKD